MKLVPGHPADQRERARWNYFWGALPQALGKLEPRFAQVKGEYTFKVDGDLGFKTFTQIRATPDFESQQVDVKIEHDHWDGPTLSGRSTFPLRMVDLSGEPEKDARLYASRLQQTVQHIYLSRVGLSTEIGDQVAEAFAPAPGTETPLMSFLDRVAVIQKAHTAVVTRRIIGLTEHLRKPSELPDLPESTPPPMAAVAALDSPGRGGR